MMCISAAGNAQSSWHVRKTTTSFPLRQQQRLPIASFVTLAKRAMMRSYGTFPIMFISARLPGIPAKCHALTPNAECECECRDFKAASLRSVTRSLGFP